MTSSPTATVVVITRNRKDELRVAIRSCREQSVPLDVLVVDDASADGTADMVRQEFPEARLEPLAEASGYIRGRNLAAAMVTTPFLFSIDDDARFESSLTVEQTLTQFANPFIAAVAIPYVDAHVSPEVLSRAPDDGTLRLTDTFVGTAYAVRTDVFRRTGGFDEGYFHQVEEQEFCMRLLRSGRFVALGTADPIVHEASPVRNLELVALHDARNNVLLAWQHLPTPAMLRSMLRNLLFFIRTGLARGHARSSLRGLWSGLLMIARREVVRAPMSKADHRLLRELRLHPRWPLPSVDRHGGERALNEKAPPRRAPP